MKKIGLLVPATNLTVEYELEYLYSRKVLIHDEINCYVAKLNYTTSYKENKLEFLKQLAEDSLEKAKQLEYIGVDYIASFCTSASITSSIKMINNPADAIIDEAQNRKMKNCMLLTPYDDKIGEKVKATLEENNIKVIKMINLNLLDTKEYFEFGRYKLEKFLIDNYKKEYGDIIISCTNIPTIHFIDKLEIMLDTNILSSNYCVFKKIIDMKE